MCDCRYASDPTTGIPEVVLDHAKYFPDTGKAAVCVDACIAEAVKMLWHHGIRTRHSCCGHNGKFGAASLGLDSHYAVARAAELLRSDGRDWRLFVDVSAIHSKEQSE
tara:strand:- start:176 stop:499 length:324 start_codon:yes stop_codon:yes gene_type:complete